MPRILTARGPGFYPRGFIKPSKPVLDPAHPLSHGLLSCWLLGGTPKSLGIDIGPRGAHMVPSGTINQVSSHHGGTASQVTSADTTSRYASASFQLKSTDSYSISFWANVRAATGVNSRLYEFSAGVEMYGPGNSNYNITNDDGSHNITPSFTPTVGVWFHVVVTCATGGTAQCYINGALLASGSIGAIPNTTGGLSVGNNAGLSRFFDGSLEGYRWYNRIVSAQEAAWLYVEPYAGIYNTSPEYFVGAAAGPPPSFNPGWATGATRMISGGLAA